MGHGVRDAAFDAASASHSLGATSDPLVSSGLQRAALQAPRAPETRRVARGGAQVVRRAARGQGRQRTVRDISHKIF